MTVTLKLESRGLPLRSKQPTRRERFPEDVPTSLMSQVLGAPPVQIGVTWKSPVAALARPGQVTVYRPVPPCVTDPPLPAELQVLCGVLPVLR